MIILDILYDIILFPFFYSSNYIDPSKCSVILLLECATDLEIRKIFDGIKTRNRFFDDIKTRNWFFDVIKTRTQFL